jgi:acyl carrier protein
LPQLPRTRHGKVDLRALPAPEPVTVSASAPRSEAEAQLAAIWREVLGLEAVGMSDNFFELGGHSLLAMKLVAAIRDAFGVAVSVARVFEATDLAALAAEIESLRGGDRELSDALNELRNLSPEELQALLANEHR